MTSSRRDFVRRLAGLSALAATPLPWGAGDRLIAQQGLRTREIPGTGEMLPVVGLGSSKPVLDIPSEGTEPLVAVIRTLLESWAAVWWTRRPAAKRSTPASAKC